MSNNYHILDNDWDRYASKKIYTPRGNLGIFRSIGFGVFSFFSISMSGVIGAWLLFFYTTFCGLTPGQGASIFLIGRVFDGIASLIMGNVSDNMYKYKIGRKFGRRHLFILVAAPAVFVSVTVWISGMNYIYYLVSYLVTSILMSVLQIPWETIPNEMTSNYNKRTLLTTARMVIAGIGNMLIQFIPAQLFRYFPKSSPTPYLLMQLIFSVITFFLILITYKSTWEHFVTKIEAMEMEDENIKQKNFSLYTMISNYLSTFNIKTFRIHMGIYISSYFATILWSTTFVYYIVYVLGKDVSLSGMLQSISLVSIPVTIVSGISVTKISPKHLYIFGYFLILISCIVWGILGINKPSNMLIFLIFGMLCYQIGLYILYFLPWNLFPFIPDIDTLVTGKNRSGLFASVMVFINQVSQGLAAVVAGYLLSLSGFKASSHGVVSQQGSAIHMILVIVSVGVGIMIVIAMIFASKLKLNKKNYTILTSELNRLKNGGNMKDVDKHTKEICNQLTGIEYEKIQCWNK